MDATLAFPILVGLIAVALLFDFLNGLHDAANSIATIVSTRVLRPQYAVLWAAFFNFIAFLFFGLHVANTIGTGIIEPSVIDAQVIFGALIGAIVWNLITWGLGIPSSQFARADRRAGRRRRRQGRLCGGRSGAGCRKTLLAIVLSPLVGFLLALVLVAIVSWAVGALDAVRGRPRLPHPAVRLGLALFARPWRQRRAEDHGHHRGAALFARAISASEFSVPFWVVISCQAAMALGTLMGGWRIVHTMGSKITG